MIHIQAITDRGRVVYNQKHTCAVMFVHKPDGVFVIINKMTLNNLLRAEMRVEQGKETSLTLYIVDAQEASLVRLLRVLTMRVL
jgi:hypothetical protein